MADILNYFLYGKETLQRVRQRAQVAAGGWVERTSQLWYDQVTMTIDDVNEHRNIPLEVGDYNFANDYLGDAKTYNSEGHWQNMEA